MNKTILVTGASSGIGRAAAKLFQKKGWNVIATMRSPEKESELKELENRAGADCEQLLGARDKMSDEEFFAMQQQMLGL
ncbi:MAG: SDR family NAD(P)-dependent oxidoreductase [Saprospiraceae bacterium]